MTADKTGKKQRGKPFEKGQSGNPNGRPQGSRNRATLAAEVLLEGEAEKLTRKAVKMALNGDTNLSDTQQTQVRFFTRATFRGIQNSFFQHRKGMISEKANNRNVA